MIRRSTLLFLMVILAICSTQRAFAVPADPTTCIPTSGSVNQSITPNLVWSTSAGATGYDVYFGTMNPPTTRVSYNQSGNNYNPGTLVSYTVYYWKVIARNSTGTSPGTMNWYFRTIRTVPNDPTNPNPTNNATGIATNQVLSWTASYDADMYDVYFGTTNPPTTRVSQNQTGTTYTPTLSISTTYYWKVLARNAVGYSPGTIWRFTTGSQPNYQWNVSTLDFGNRGYRPTFSVDDTVYVENNGATNGTLSITPLSSTNFLVVSPTTSFSLAPGDSQAVILRFDPTTPGTLSSTFTANGTNSPTISVSGTTSFHSPPVQASDSTNLYCVHLTWPIESFTVYYRVFRSTTNDTATAIAMGTWTTLSTYDDSSAVAGTVYYYWVKMAFNSSGAYASDLYIAEPGSKLRPTTLVVTPDPMTPFLVAGGQQFLTITISGGRPTSAWRIDTLPSWISLSSNNSFGTRTIIVTAPANTGIGRSDSLRVFLVEYPTTYQWVSVSQETNITTLTATPNPIQVGSAESAVTLTASVTGHDPSAYWHAGTVPSWIQVIPSGQYGSGTTGVYIDANTGITRTDSIGLNCYDDPNVTTTWVRVIQHAGPPILSVSPTTISQFVYGGGSQNTTVTIGGGNPSATWTTSNVPSWITLNPTTSTGTRTVSVTASANTGLARSDSFQVASSGATGSPVWVKVSQATLPTTLSVSPTTITQFAYGGGSQTTTITIGGGNPSATWITGNIPSWITLNPATSTGTRTVTITAAMNSSTARSDSFQVTSTGATGSPVWVKVSQVASTTISVSANPMSQFVYTGGTQNLTVTVAGSSPTATWSTSNVPSWITLNPTTYAGTRTITVTAAANAGTTRSDSFQVVSTGAVGSPTWVKVSQAYAGTLLTVTPTTMPQFNGTLRSQSIALSISGTNPTAAWTISNLPSWISVNSSSGSGSASVTVSAVTNTGAARADSFRVNCTASIVNPIWVKVSQDHAPVTVSIVVFEGDLRNLAYNGQDIQFFVSVQGYDPTESRTADQFPSWAPGTPYGDGFTLHIAANPGFERTDSIRVTCINSIASPYYVVLRQNPALTSMSVTPTTLSQFAKTGGTQTTAVSFIGRLLSSPWTASNIPSWISLSPSSGAGGSSISVTAQANSGIARADSFQVSSTGIIGSPIWVKVSQAAGSLLSTSLTTIPQFTDAGGAQSFSVNVTGGISNATWTASNIPSWITLNPTTFAGTRTVVATASANTGIARADSFQVASTGAVGSPLWVRVSQAVGATTLSVLPTIVTQFANSGGSQNVTVSVGGGNPTATWTTSNVPSWITLNPTSYAGSRAVSVTAQASFISARSDSFRIACTGATGSPVWVKVSQAVGATTLAVNPTTLSLFNATVTSQPMAITIGGYNLSAPWTINSVPSWVNVSSVSGSGSANLTVSTVTNTGAARVDSFRVNCPGTLGSPIWVKVSQDHAPVSLNIYPNSDANDQMRYEGYGYNGTDYFLVYVESTGYDTHEPWTVDHIPSWCNDLYTSQVDGTILFRVTPNTGFERSDTLRVLCANAIGSPYNIILRQNPFLTSMVVSPTTITQFPAIGNSQIISLSFTGRLLTSAWSTSNVPSWISLNPSSGNGGRSIAVVASANGGVARADSFQISSTGIIGSPVWVKVSQTAGTTLSTSLTTLPQFSNSGGSQSVTVNVTGGITNATWTTSNVPSWISLIPTTYAGTRTVTVTALANAGGARSDSFQVNSTGAVGSPIWVKVSQAAGATIFSVSPNPLAQFDPQGMAQNLSISISGGNPTAAWSVANLPSWISLNSSSGAGSATVTVTASANSGVARSDSFQVSSTGATGSPIWVRVSQAAAPPTISISPTTIPQYSSTGGSQDVTVTIGGGDTTAAWTFGLLPEWLVLSIEGEMRGSQLLHVILQYNEGVARADSFPIICSGAVGSPVWIKVSQAAGPTTFAVTPTTIPQFSSSGGTYDVAATIGGGDTTAAWTFGTFPYWLILVVDTEMRGSQTIHVMAEYNDGIARSDSFQIVCAGAVGSPIWVRVSQAAAPPTISISPTTIPQYSSTGGSQDVTVTIGGGDTTAAWTFGLLPEWLVLSIEGEMRGSKLLHVILQYNEGVARVDSFPIICSGAVGSPVWIKVSQAAGPTTFAVTPTTIPQFSSSGGTYDVAATIGGGDTTAAWTFGTFPYWLILVVDTEMRGSQTIHVMAEYNDGIARSDSFQIVCAGAVGSPIWVRVSQAAAPPTISISPTTIPQYSSTGGSQDVTVTIGGGDTTAAWTFGLLPEWLVLSIEGEMRGSQLLHVILQYNEGAARADSFPIICSGAVGSPVWIKVSQAAGTLPLVAAISPIPSSGSVLMLLPPELSWNGDPSNPQYDIYLGTSNPPLTCVATNLATSSFTPSTLVGDGIYYWYVVSHNATDSIPSVVWSFMIDSSVPTLSITYSSNEAHLTWNATAFPQVKIYRSTSSAYFTPSIATLLMTVPSSPNSYVDSPVTGQYYYKVTYVSEGASAK